MDKEETKKQLFNLGFGNWNGELLLLTPKLLENVPDGTLLHSISDSVVIKGKSEIDLDTRGGFLAYGIKPYQYREAIGWIDGSKTNRKK